MTLEAKNINHEWTKTVICPYCGDDNGADDGDGPRSGEQECISCSKKFSCEPTFTVRYTTQKVDCWNGETHNWGDVYYPVYPENEGYKTCKGCWEREWVKGNDSTI